MRAGLRVVVDDVEDIPVGGLDEESMHAPGFMSEGVHDLVSALLDLFVRCTDVRRQDRRDGIQGSGCVASDELDTYGLVVRTGLGGGESRDPAQIEVLCAEPEKLRVEAPCGRDVSDMQIGENANDFHAAMLVARGNPVESASRDYHRDRSLTVGPSGDARSGLVGVPKQQLGPRSRVSEY